MKNKTLINEKYYYNLLSRGQNMKLLMLKKKDKKKYSFLKQAFEEKGFTVKTADLKELSLFSDMKNSRVEGPKLGFKNIEAVYFESGLELTSFTEPLLDEIERREIYCQVKKNSHYILSNELLQITMLNNFNIKIPRTFILRNLDRVNSISPKLSYPVLFKVFSNGKKDQSTIVESEKSLFSVSRGIKKKMSGVLLREFIEGDVDQVAVIGKRVFSIQRKLEQGELQELKKAKLSVLSTQDKETAIQAASICGCDIATVKMCKGYVLKVKPLVNFLLYNKKTGDNLFEHVAEFYVKKTGLEKPMPEPEQAGKEDEINGVDKND